MLSQAKLVLQVLAALIHDLGRFGFISDASDHHTIVEALFDALGRLL